MDDLWDRTNYGQLYALQRYFPTLQAFGLARGPYFRHLKILTEYEGNPFFYATYTQVRAHTLCTKLWNDDYNSHRGLQTRTSWVENKGRERFTLAYVLADRTIFWLRNFLKNSASNLCSAAWGPPRMSCRKSKSDEEGYEKERGEKSKTNTRVQERVSRICAWGKSSRSTLLTFIALTFTITAFKSTGLACVCVCMRARVCVMSQRSGYIQDYSQRNQLHMKTLTKAIHHNMSRTLAMR